MKPHIVAIDTETFLIRPGLRAPRLVCGSWAERWNSELKVHVTTRNTMLCYVHSLLKSDVIIVGHNIVYDFAVMASEDPILLPLIFQAYEQGRIRCTQIRQKLLDIAKGEHKFHLVWIEDQDLAGVDKAGVDRGLRHQTIKTEYSLDKLVWRWTKKTLPKQDTWRLRYSELANLSIDQYPPEAIEYAGRDAAETLKVYEHQGADMVNEVEQNMAAWALHLMSVYGLRTDPSKVADLEKRLQEETTQQEVKLKEYGFLRQNGAKNMDAIGAVVAEAYLRQKQLLPLTTKGKISTDKQSILGAHDPKLDVLLESKAIEKLFTTYLPVIKTGTNTPINPNYDSLIETGRTSSFNPNIQQLPRKGGIRECFIPRPGFVYVSCDYDTVELRGLAQVCLVMLKESAMATALHQDEDLHSSFAASILGMQYSLFTEKLKAGEKTAEETRQFAKIANFGFPGGLAPKTFVLYAKNYGVSVSENDAEELRRQWFQRWPEMPKYFSVIKSMTSYPNSQIVQLYSQRKRGGVTFTQAANSFFQGLVADGAKAAMWQVSKECYWEEKSVLFGARPVVFLHDELILEIRENTAAEGALRLKDIMIAQMKRYMPDVPVKASPVLMRRWWKGAKPVYQDGCLVPSKPLKTESGMKWVSDQ